MVESENSSNNYQTLKTIIGAIINNPEMRNFVANPED